MNRKQAAFHFAILILNPLSAKADALLPLNSSMTLESSTESLCPQETHHMIGVFESVGRRVGNADAELKIEARRLPGPLLEVDLSRPGKDGETFAVSCEFRYRCNALYELSPSEKMQFDNNERLCLSTKIPGTPVQSFLFAKEPLHHLVSDTTTRRTVWFQRARFEQFLYNTWCSEQPTENFSKPPVCPPFAPREVGRYWSELQKSWEPTRAGIDSYFSARCEETLTPVQVADLESQCLTMARLAPLSRIFVQECCASNIDESKEKILATPNASPGIIVEPANMAL